MSDATRKSMMEIQDNLRDQLDQTENALEQIFDVASKKSWLQPLLGGLPEETRSFCIRFTLPSRRRVSQQVAEKIAREFQLNADEQEQLTVFITRYLCGDRLVAIELLHGDFKDKTTMHLPATWLDKIVTQWVRQHVGAGF